MHPRRRRRHVGPVVGQVRRRARRRTQRLHTRRVVVEVERVNHCLRRSGCLAELLARLRLLEQRATFVELYTAEALQSVDVDAATEYYTNAV